MYKPDGTKDGREPPGGILLWRNLHPAIHAGEQSYDKSVKPQTIGLTFFLSLSSDSAGFVPPAVAMKWWRLAVVATFTLSCICRILWT